MTELRSKPITAVAVKTLVVGSSESRQYWGPHLVGGVVCACAANAMIPWLVSTFANEFPLAHDDYQVPGMILYFVIVVLCWNHVVHVFDVRNCTGHEKVRDGPRKHGRKPLDEPYVDTHTSEEKMAAWHFTRAVAFRYTVNAHTSVWACHHNVGGIDVRPPVMQLCPWGNQVA
jgi:hypothetical protein